MGYRLLDKQDRNSNKVGNIAQDRKNKTKRYSLEIIDTYSKDKESE